MSSIHWNYSESRITFFPSFCSSTHILKFYMLPGKTCLLAVFFGLYTGASQKGLGSFEFFSMCKGCITVFCQHLPVPRKLSRPLRIASCVWNIYTLQWLSKSMNKLIKRCQETWKNHSSKSRWIWKSSWFDGFLKENKKPLVVWSVCFTLRLKMERQYV